jgi:protein-disulfide isomerase
MKREANEWLIPGAIVFAGIVLSITIFMTRPHLIQNSNGHPELTKPVSASDHIYGNPSAPVVLIEYSDIDSEYSKDFEKVMEQIMQDYGSQGSVAWVFRHLPLGDQDLNSEEHAEAAECVAALGKPSDFFAFIDAVQAIAPGDSQFDPADYDSVVSALGISTGSFDGCLTNHTYAKKVASDYQNAQQIGATGTPYNILLVRGQKPIVISGLVPYTTMKQIMDLAIQKSLTTTNTN